MDDTDLLNHDSLVEPKSFAIIKDDFLDLGDETDMKAYLNQPESNTHLSGEKFVAKMDDWDQDVLLSNAGLPEMNPLLELGNSVEDDFQKMLSDWENQIDSMQANESQPDHGQYILPTMDERESEDRSIDNQALSDMTDDVFQTESSNDAVEAPIDVKEESKGSEKKTRPSLTGIVISSGPGGHFETYEVLEAADDDAEMAEVEEDLFREYDEKNGSPYKKSQIIAAVHNHFSVSSSKKPKIVPSRRIKHALPREVIEKIKSSSQKARTIAIIEPVHHGDGRTNATFNHLNNTPYDQQPQQRRSTKFEEAASRLNKSKQMRQMVHPPVQVSLDHDYCSSANKVKRSSKAVTAAAAAASASTPTYQRISSPASKPPPPPQRYYPAKNVLMRPNNTVTVKKSNLSMPIVVSSSAGFSTTGGVTRPYVRVSTGSRVVTANLLKPTPLSSASMLRSDNCSTIAKSLSDGAKAKPAFRPTTVTSRIVETTPAKLLRVQGAGGPAAAAQRRDSDHKKDSGLESGELSDASEQSLAANDDDASAALYSKVPPYLTTVAVKNSDTSISAADDAGYDRLPAYIRGVTRDEDKTVPMLKQTKKVVIVRAAGSVGVGGVVSGHHGSEGRERHCSSSSSEGSSTSTSHARMSTRSMTTRRQTPKRHRSRSSSTSSNCSNTSSSYHQVKKAPKRRCWHRKGSDSPPPPPSRRRRYRSPSSHSRFTRDRQRREQETRHQDQEDERRNEERRIVYVGKIAEGTTRADLRSRFEVFGPVMEISVHFRDRGDNYGFITFKYKVDAYEAIEHGNDDPAYPAVDLCFGGRRAFCKEKYSDLDSHGLDPDVEEVKYHLRASSSSSGGGGNRKAMLPSLSSEGSMDFDSLLQQARAEMTPRAALRK